MIQVTFTKGENHVRVNGLTQWDYGQVLQITGLGPVQNAEIHFASEGCREAEIQIAKVENEILYAQIPNKLLEKGRNIKAYVYLATPETGETVRMIALPVKPRAKPDDYSTPEEQNLLRKILDEIKGKADNLKGKDGYIQLLSGAVPIGDRVRIPAGSGGVAREIELRNNGYAIEWRYTDSNEWTELIQISELRGKDGETPEFEIRDGHLIAIYKN